MHKLISVETKINNTIELRKTVCIYPVLLTLAGYDTRSIFKRSSEERE